MKLSESTLNSTKRVLAERRIQKYLNEGLTKDQIQAKLIEEGFGDFIRKGIDTVKKKTGLGMSMQTRKAFGMAKTVMSDYGTFLETEFPTAQEIKVMTDFMKQLGGEAGGKGLRSAASGRNAMDKLPRNKRRNLQQPNLLRKEIKKFLKEMDAAREALPPRSDKTSKKARQVINAAEEQLEGKLKYLSDLRKAFDQAIRTGETEAIETVARLEREQDRKIARAAKIAFSKEQEAQAKADREARRKARNANRKDDEMSFTGGQMSTKSRYAEERALAERAVQKYLKEGLSKDQIQAKLIEEGFGDFIRKGIDTVKQKTGLGMSMKNREIKEKVRSKYSVFMEYMNEEMPTARELSMAVTAMAQQGRSRTRGFGFEQETFKSFPKKKRATLMGNTRNVVKRIREMKKFIIDATDGYDRKDKTSKKMLKFTNALHRELDVMLEVLRSFRKEARRAEKTGETEGAEALAKELRAAEVARERAANIAFAKDQEKSAKADREMRRKARNRAANEPGDIIRGKSTERFGLGTKGSGG